ncbi:conserved hypothetical protein [Histoplasma capsulatum H143]|uniref:Uncharacterized protein n=1 Tax=Ajellomyces capsulatus (strain H143) TaxID=544712 RepID=C6H9W4_AJECH|nr:conserved hypothetical protein [Histoplasma capsulatum H143]
MRTSFIVYAALAALGFVDNVLAMPTSPSNLVLAKRGVKECDSDSDYTGPYQDGQVPQSAQVLARLLCCRSECVLCSAAQLNGTQVCQTRSQTVSASMGLKIDAAVSKGIVPGLFFGVEFSSSIEDSECYSASSTTTCTWNDKACHTVWTQQQMVLTKGYERKRCNWGNGDVTECMRSWEQNTPTTYTDYGCGSKCEDTNYCGNTNGQPCH